MAKDRTCHASWQDMNSLELDILYSWIRMRKIQELHIFVKKSVEVTTWQYGNTHEHLQIEVLPSPLTIP